jgi:DNA segregation ATPase FtsK/SpoIIIE-like protein
MIDQLIAAEIKLINQMLVAHAIQARTLAKLTMCVKSSFIAYGLEVARGESVSKIERIQRELSNELTRQRVRLIAGYSGKTVVRLRDYPLAIEVPHPTPVPLAWQAAPLRVGRFHALIGRSYSYNGAREEWLDLERHYHTLVAAMSGGGKSTLMRMALISLALNTDPELLQIMLVGQIGSITMHIV